MQDGSLKVKVGFPRFRAGTFIEAGCSHFDACDRRHFPAFGWGLSLRRGRQERRGDPCGKFPPSGGDFVTTLDVNREASRGLRSPVLETNLVSRTGLFFSKHEDTLYVPSTADSSCQLAESEMTKSDADNLQRHYGEVISEEQNRLAVRVEIWFFGSTA